MRSLLILYLLCLANVSLFSQEKLQTKSEFAAQSSFSMGPSYTANRCYRILLTTKEDSRAFISARNEKESSTFGFNTGVKLVYWFSNNFALETGAQFSRKTYRIDHQELTSIGLVDYEGKHRFDFISLPVKLNMVVVDRRFIIAGSGGLVLNALHKGITNEKVIYLDVTFEEREYQYTPGSNIRRFGLGACAGMIVAYLVNKSFELRVEPQLQTALTSLADGDIKVFTNAAGLEFSLLVNLGNAKR